MANISTIGQKIKDFRKVKRLSVKAFAEKYGFKQDSVYKWQKGTKPSDPEEYKKLESILENNPKGKSLDDEDFNPDQSLNDLIATNRKLADAHYEMALAHKELALANNKHADNNAALINRLVTTEDGQEETALSRVATFAELMRVVAEVGTGVKKWASLDEAVAELNNRVYGKLQKKTAMGMKSVANR
ncbi:MAG: helix-turn-helix transcriptional regulator [Ferruginibacter sp.]